MKFPIGFTIRHNGFYVTFENGYTISVVFAYGNYCDNYSDISTRYFGGVDHIRSYLNAFPKVPEYGYPESIHCANGEIAIFAPNGDWVTRKVMYAVFGIDCDDDVVGHITPGQFLALCNYISSEI